MGKRSTYSASVGFGEINMAVELIGVLDSSEGAFERNDRVQTMVSKIILLGQKRGRPRKECIDEAEIAA